MSLGRRQRKNSWIDGEPDDDRSNTIVKIDYAWWYWCDGKHRRCGPYATEQTAEDAKRDLENYERVRNKWR